MFLGIEIGGTKLQLAVGAGQRPELAARLRCDVQPAAGAEGILRQIEQTVPSMMREAGLANGRIQGIGIGFGGPVDAAAGIVTKSHHVTGWEGFPLARWCEQQLGRPAVVHNDADTAGLAEARFGAGRGFDPVFYITVGTGIGGGFIVGEKIYRGSGAGAAEIGHLRPCRFECKLLSPVTTVESAASGWGVASRVRAAIKEGRGDNGAAAELLDCCGGDAQRLTTQLVGEAAGKGNPLARAALDDACRTLGWAVAQVVALLNPARVVVGGGVSLLGEALFFEPLRRGVRSFVFEPFADCAEIVPAALGEEVVLHGALALARDAFASAAR